jgi:hypothetical protein
VKCGCLLVLLILGELCHAPTHVAFVDYTSALAASPWFGET